MHLSESRKFRTQLNIYDGVFSQKQLITVNRFSRYLFFLKKAPSQMFDQVLNAPLTPSTPPNYFCVRIIKTWRFFSTAELSSIPGTTLKSTFILLPFSINFISFATAFHALVTTPFSLYHLRCLSDSARHCFTFSHFLHFLLEWLLSTATWFEPTTTLFLIESVRSSLTHLHGFQLLVLLPQFVEILFVLEG